MKRLSKTAFIFWKTFVLFPFLIQLTTVSCEKCVQLLHGSEEFRFSAGMYDVDTITPSLCQALCREGNFSYAAIMDTKFCLCSYTNYDYPELDGQKCCSVPPEDCGNDTDVITAMEVDDIPDISIQLKAEVSYEGSGKVILKYEFECATNTMSKIYLFYDGQLVADPISTGDEPKLKQTNDFKDVNIPGYHEVKVIAADEATNLYSSSDSQEIWIPDAKVSFKLDCPDFGETEENITCIVSTLRGTDLTLEFDFGDGLIEVVSVPDAAKFSLAFPVPFVPKDDASESEVPETVQIGLNAIPTSMLIAFELFANTSGKFEVKVLSPTCEDGKIYCGSCKDSCEERGVSECSGDETFSPSNLACVDLDSSTYSQYSIDDTEEIKSYTIEVDAGYMYYALEENDYVQLEPGYLFLLKRIEENVVKYVDASEYEIKTGNCDIDQDGNALNVRHLIRPIVAMPTDISFCHSYTKAGKYEIKASIISDFSDDLKDDKQIRITIVEPLSGLNMSEPINCTDVGASATLKASVDTGMNVTFVWKAEGFDERSYTIEEPPNPVRENFTCSSERNFTVNLDVTDQLRSENASVSVCCINHVSRNWELSTDSPKITPPGIVTVVFRYTGNSSYFPIGAAADLDFGDGQVEEGILIEEDKVVTKEHIYERGGAYNITVRAYNKYDEELFVQKVDIYDKLGVLEVHATYAMDEDGPESGLHGPDKTDLPVNAFVSFNTSISGSVEFYKILLEDDEEEQDKENNIFKKKFETVGEYAATFTASNPLETSNNVTLPLRVMRAAAGLELAASPSSLMPDEEVEFTLQYESVDQFTCVAFDAGGGDPLETFGNRDTCEALLLEDSHYNPINEERKRREVEDVTYIEENKISIKYTYRSGGLFEPTAKAFNTIFETNATTLVNVTYPPSSIWIENNSTNIKRPMKFFRKETFRLETTALVFERPGRQYEMRWKVDQITSSQQVVKNVDISMIRSSKCSVIRFPSRFLEVGLYHITYFIDIIANETVEETLSCFTFLEIMSSEQLLPMIIKGGASYILRGFKQMVYLEAGIYSEDPDEPEDKNFQMSWSCRSFEAPSFLSENEEYDEEVSLSENVITSVKLEKLTPNPECFKKKKRAKDFKGRNFNFNTEELRNFGILYEFQVTVSKNKRSEKSVIFLDVIENIPPGIIITCEKSVACEILPNGGFLVNPNDWLAVRAECISDCGKGNIQYEWDIYGIEEQSQEATAIDDWKNYIIIDEDRLGINRTFFAANPDIKSYHIGVKGSDEKRSKGSAKLYIKLNNPPNPGSCKISENSGVALITTFNLDFKGWTDEDGHELKDFSIYSIYKGRKSHLHYGVKTSVQFKLPPGESEIICAVKDQMGAVTEEAVGTITADPPTKEDLEEWKSTTNFKFFMVEGQISMMIQSLASAAILDEMNRKDSHLSIAATVEQIWEAYKDLQGIDTSYFTKEAREEIEAEVRDKRAAEKEIEAKENFKMLDNLQIIPFEVLEDAEVYGEAVSTLAVTRPLNKASKNLLKGFIEEMADSIFSMEVPHPSDREIANRLTANTMNSLSETISGEVIGGNFLRSELEEAYELLSYNITQPNFFILFVNGSRWEVEEKVHQKKVEGAKNISHEDIHDQVDLMKNVTERMKTSIAQDLMVGENPLVVDTSSGFQLTVEKRLADEVSGETIEIEGTSITLPSSCVLLGKEPNCKESGVVGLVSVKWSSILEPGGTDDVNLSAESNTLDFSLTNRHGNDTSTIRDSSEPFEVCLAISPPAEDDRGGSRLRPVLPSFDGGDEFLVYHQLAIDKSGEVAVMVDFAPDDDDGGAFVLFYGAGYKPTLRVYDGRVFLKKMERQIDKYSMLFNVDSEPGEDFFLAVGYLAKGSLKKKATFEEDKNLTRDDMTNEFSTGYSIALFTTGCYFFSEEQSVWSSDGCKVKSARENAICCLCNHLTMFGSGFVIAPNTIDFSSVFANAGFKDNLIIYLALIFSLALYIILIIWARWKDKKDITKLGATPLADNNIHDKYVYEILVQTGFQYNSGTKSKVHFIISGDNEETDVRTFFDDKREIFQRGSINSFVMTVPRCLGQLNYLRIWHDNSGGGKEASWYLEHVVVKDVMTGYKYEFIAERWFAVEEGDKMIDHLLPVAGREQTTQFSHLFPSASRRNLADNHLWLSVFTRPLRSRFTRVQRLSCCVAIFYLSMLTSAMWYETTTEQPSTGGFRFGPLSMSPEQIVVGLMSNLVVFPPSFLMIILFRKSRARALRPSHVNVALDHQYERWRKQYALPKRQGKNVKPESRQDVEAYGRPQKKKCLLPWWCAYIGWFLVILSIGSSIFFLWAYGLQFGNVRTRKWLTSMVISFFSSVLLTEPLKIFCLSLVMACVCGNTDVDNDDLDDDEEDPYLKPDEEWLHNVSPAVNVQRPKYHPIDPESLEAARKIREKEVQMYALFKEICAYAFYLWVLIILSYGNRDPNSFFMRETTINNFLKPGDLWHDFHHVNNEVKFWNWTKNALLPELFAGLWYNGRIPLGLRLLIDDRSNFKIGYPVLRQVRARTDSCTVPMEMTLVVDECAGFGSMVYEDGRIYSKSWGHNLTLQSRIPPEYKYMTASDLNGYPFWGQLDWYGGGGYVVPLIAKRYEDGAKLIRKMEYLEKTGWINKDTRAVFVEFGTYNPGVNLFVVATIVAEFLPGGGIIPYYHIDPIKLLYYHTGSGLLILLSQIGFVLFTLYYTYEVFCALKKSGRKYFDEYWNVADLSNLLAAYSTIAVEAYKMVVTSRILAKFTETEGTGYIKLQEALLLDGAFCYLIGFLMSLATLKFLKLLRFNKRIGGMIATVRLCAQELKGYGVCLLITFFAFVSLFWMILGRGVREFCSFAAAFESSISMMLKKFDYPAMEGASPVLAPIAFFTFALTASLVLVNILLTIIIQSFEEVKGEVAGAGDHHQLMDFVKKRIKLMLGRSSGVTPAVTYAPAAVAGRDGNEAVNAFSGKVDKLLDFINSVYLDEQVDMEFLSKNQLTKQQQQQLPELEKKKSRPRKIPRYQPLHMKKHLDF